MSTRPLRIALVSEHASPLARLGGIDAGGQNVYVANVARCLADAGHQVDVLTRRDDASLPAVVDFAPGVRVVHVAAGPAEFVAKEAMLGFMPEFAARATRFLREGGHDLVHANFFMSGLVGLHVKARLDIPLVVTFHALGLVRRRHQPEADAFPAERIDIERRLVATADRLIAECPQDEADLIELYGASPQRIDTIPCGVDLDEFVPLGRHAARRTLGMAEDGFVVLQLGRIVPRKGVDNVIRALSLMAPSPAHATSQPPARLVVVGGDASGAETAETGRLRRLAADCGVAERVAFVGHRQRADLAAFYGACDVFVTTPWYEPFGITPLEAMASARPVVGSAVGGIQHTVRDGETGFLVPAHDPAALAERLERLQSEPMLAWAMGRAGRRRATADYTWQRVADELVSVYRAVVPARSRHRPAVASSLAGRGAARPWTAAAAA